MLLDYYLPLGFGGLIWGPAALLWCLGVKPGVESWSLVCAREVLLEKAAKARLHLQKPQPWWILQSQASGDLVTGNPSFCWSHSPSHKGRREQGRNELTLPLPGLAVPLPSLTSLSPRPLAGWCCQGRRVLRSQACQILLVAFAECIIRASGGFRQTERTKKVLRFGPVSRNWKIFAKVRVSMDDMFLHMFVLTCLLIEA